MDLRLHLKDGVFNRFEVKSMDKNVNKIIYYRYWNTNVIIQSWTFQIINNRAKLKKCFAKNDAKIKNAYFWVYIWIIDQKQSKW